MKLSLFSLIFLLLSQTALAQRHFGDHRGGGFGPGPGPRPGFFDAGKAAIEQSIKQKVAKIQEITDYDLFNLNSAELQQVDIALDNAISNIRSVTSPNRPPAPPIMPPGGPGIGYPPPGFPPGGYPPAQPPIMPYRLARVKAVIENTKVVEFDVRDSQDLFLQCMQIPSQGNVDEYTVSVNYQTPVKVSSSSWLDTKLELCASINTYAKQQGLEKGGTQGYSIFGNIEGSNNFQFSVHGPNMFNRACVETLSKLRLPSNYDEAQFNINGNPVIKLNSSSWWYANSPEVICNIMSSHLK